MAILQLLRYTLHDPTYLHYRCRRHQSHQRPPLWATKIKTKTSKSCWRPCNRWTCSICTNRRSYIRFIPSTTITIIVIITITIIIITNNSNNTSRATIRKTCSSAPQLRTTLTAVCRLAPRWPPPQRATRRLASASTRWSTWSTTTGKKQSCILTTKRSFMKMSTRTACRWSNTRHHRRRRRHHRHHRPVSRGRQVCCRRPASHRGPLPRPPPLLPCICTTIRSCSCNTRTICRRRCAMPSTRPCRMAAPRQPRRRFLCCRSSSRPIRPPPVQLQPHNNWHLPPPPPLQHPFALGKSSFSVTFREFSS